MSNTNERRKALGHPAEQEPAAAPAPLTPERRQNIMTALLRDEQLCELGAPKGHWWAVADLLKLALTHPVMAKHPETRERGAEMMRNVYAMVIAHRPDAEKDDLLAMADQPIEIRGPQTN